jgi:NADPH:quinone reductase-like Zn-dependent oxidoreductase
MPTNTAAYLNAVGEPLEVKTAPYTAPGEDQIVIQNKAIAINPVDYAIQMMGQKLFSWLKFPTIIGEDVAGEVVEIGSGVTDFKVGDRVVGHTTAAFQTYPVLASYMASQLPDSVSYEQAAVIPLGLSTALLGLFHPEYLALQFPSVDAQPTGKTLLIWGGATSVGSNAIQATVAAGYEVITTASPKNFDYVKKLGASQALDYNSASVVEDLIAAFKGKDCAGALAIAGVVPQPRAAAATACINVVAKSEGNKFVALTMPPPPNLPEGTKYKFANASNLINEKEIGAAIYNKFLPKALASGKFTPAPTAEVVGNGLESLQLAMDTLKKGVSAKKLVVTL